MSLETSIPLHVREVLEDEGVDLPMGACTEMGEMAVKTARVRKECGPAEDRAESLRDLALETANGLAFTALTYLREGEAAGKELDLGLIGMLLERHGVELPP